MPRVVHPEEFQNPNTVTLARWLLGKLLVRTQDGTRREHVITEVEAYHTQRDLACHASKGRTARTEVMFAPGGRWYVYLCYGIHEMLNLVTGPENHPAAILIRGVDGIVGPGRVTRQLEIGRTLNGLPATRASGLHVEDAGIRVTGRRIIAGPRIGVDYAGEIWAAKPWRFRYTPPVTAGRAARPRRSRP